MKLKQKALKIILSEWKPQFIDLLGQNLVLLKHFSLYILIGCYRSWKYFLKNEQQQQQKPPKIQQFSLGMENKLTVKDSEKKPELF